MEWRVVSAEASWHARQRCAVVVANFDDCDNSSTDKCYNCNNTEKRLTPSSTSEAVATYLCWLDLFA